MTFKQTIETLCCRFFACLFLLICLYPARSQSLPVPPAAVADSLEIIKQLLKAQVLQQLKQYKSYQPTAAAGLQKLTGDTTMLDSLGKYVLQQVARLKNTGIHTGKSAIGNAMQTPSQVLKQQFDVLVQKGNIHDLIGQFCGIIRQPVFKWSGISINIAGQSAPLLLNSGNSIMNTISIAGNCVVMGIPVGGQFWRQDVTGPLPFSRNSYTFQFDREAYLHSLRDKVKLKIKANDLVPDYNAALLQVRNTLVNRLESSFDSLNAAYGGCLNSQLEKLGSAENLMKNDLLTVKNKLLSADFLQSIEQNKNQLLQLQQQLNMGEPINKVLYDSLERSLQLVTGTNKMIAAISAFKDKVQQSGLLEKLQAAEEFKNNQVQQWLQDPDKLKSFAKDQLDLNGMQKFFLNMSQLKMGLNTVSLSALSVYQYINTGVNAAFFNNKTYLFVMAGHQPGFDNVFNHLSAASFSTANVSAGIRIGKGDITESHTHISVFSYKQKQGGTNSSLINTVPGSTLVATLSKQQKINENNYLNIELSKTAHKFNNDQDRYDTLQRIGSLSKQLLSTDNFMQQMAFSVQWNGMLKGSDLSYDLHGTITGKGYNNPGSFFIQAGMTDAVGSIRKSFLMSRLQLSAKVAYRQYAYDADAKWRNYNFSGMVKWKLKKGQYVSLSYQPYYTQRLRGNERYTVGMNSRLAAEGSIRKRFGNISYQHTLRLSSVRNMYQFDSVPADTKALLINSVQTIAIHNKIYYLNTLYNKSFSPGAGTLFNTQFNMESGLSYTICKAVIGSTSINYNSVKEWFKQAGIKQTISGQLSERCIVSVYAALAKNIKEYRTSYIDNTRIDWSLQYLLK